MYGDKHTAEQQELQTLLAKALSEPGVADAVRAHEAAEATYGQAIQATAYQQQGFAAASANVPPPTTPACLAPKTKLTQLRT